MRVIRLSGRRTPHQDLEGPLIEIIQPSISSRWATGGPPLVLTSHPSGMTPNEERFCTENRLHLYVPKLGLDGNAHLSPPEKKKGSKGMARIIGIPPWKTLSQSPGQQKLRQKDMKDIPITRGLQHPQKEAWESPKGAIKEE